MNGNPYVAAMNWVGGDANPATPVEQEAGGLFGLNIPDTVPWAPVAQPQIMNPLPNDEEMQ